MTKQGRWLQLGRGKVDQLGVDMWLGREKVKTWICLSVEDLTKSGEARRLKVGRLTTLKCRRMKIKELDRCNDNLASIPN